jgi:hypothetical protein
MELRGYSEFLSERQKPVRLVTPEAQNRLKEA